MNAITLERYNELVKAEHTCEIIKRYISDEKYISTEVLKVILNMKESEEK